jgi:hypothetical protein
VIGSGMADKPRKNPKTTKPAAQPDDLDDYLDAR